MPLDPGVFAALAKATGIGPQPLPAVGVSTPESAVPESSVQMLLNRLGLNEPQQPPQMPVPSPLGAGVSPLEGPPQSAVAALLERLGLNIPPAQGSSPMEALIKAREISAGTPTLADRALSSIIQLTNRGRGGTFGTAPRVTTTTPQDVVANSSIPLGPNPLLGPPENLRNIVSQIVSQRLGNPAGPNNVAQSGQTQVQMRMPSSSFASSLVPIDVPSSNPGTGMSLPIPRSQTSSIMPAPPTPSRWAQFGHAFLGGIADSIVPAVVGFAAVRTNSPELVESYARGEAAKLQAVNQQFQQQVELLRLNNMEREADRADRAQVDAEANIQRQLQNDARDAQSHIAPSDPDTYVKMIVALAHPYMAVGGDLNSFLDAYKVPNAPLYDKLREEYQKAFNTHFGTSGQDLRVVKNPWFPEDPTKNLTLQEAADRLRYVDSSGRVVLTTPPGETPAQLTDLTNRNAAGVETSTRVPVGQAMEAKTTKAPISPEPLSFAFTNPSTEEPTVVQIPRRVGQTTFPGLRIPQFVDPLAAFVRDIGRGLSNPTQIRQAQQYLRGALKREPTMDEVRELLQKSKAK